MSLAQPDPPTGPRVSARAVVLNDVGDVLLVEHRDGDRRFHVLPGGRVAPKETAAEAVRREVLEETGLTVAVDELLWVREYLPDRHPGNPNHTTRMQQLQLYFAAHLERGSDAAVATHPDRTQAASIWHPAAQIDQLALLPAGLAAPLRAIGRGEAWPIYLGDLP